MKRALVKIFMSLQKPIDGLMSLLIIPGALLLLVYRRIGSKRMPLTTQRLKKIGLFPIRNHYYEPLFDSTNLKEPLSSDRNLPGINLNSMGQLKFLESLKYSGELTDMNLKSAPKQLTDFCIENGSFEAGDAEFLYQTVRALKPKKIIEIGSGNSTKIAKLALQKNKFDGVTNAKHICVEPYEQPWLEKLGDIEVVRKRIEDLNFNWSQELNAGDILFVDSSHMIRPQGDVLKEYLEIFPQLASGVYIHIHDIFTPKDYLHSWVVDDVRFWNEQYLLEALLSNSDRYEIVGALNYLKHNHFDHLKKACPYLTDGSEPGSFYIRVR